ncbi:hypothetical protein SDC9_157667 [bioreactor metagenome]|uniref:Phage minor structural protein GP20 n=1 Tax=bioreactor metagenome TaxID=1076179 RepID=A0A645F9Y2_9ZZZZ|nr:phage scaffolding protein [Oscillospiraceae bacterium]
MEFLKSLFADGTLTYDQLVQKASEAKLNIVNLADGKYVSIDKYNDKINTQKAQIDDLNAKILQRDTDLGKLQNDLTAAQQDKSKLDELNGQFTTLKTKYDTDKGDFEKKLAQQQYEFLVKEKTGGITFTSVAAKKAFIADAIAKEFKVDGDNLLGFDDYLTKSKEADPGAFQVDKEPDTQTNNPPKFTLPAAKPGASGEKKFVPPIIF